MSHRRLLINISCRSSPILKGIDPGFALAKPPTKIKKRQKHTALQFLSEKNPREKRFLLLPSFFFGGGGGGREAVITLTLVMTQRDELAPAQKWPLCSLFGRSGRRGPQCANSRCASFKTKWRCCAVKPSSGVEVTVCGRDHMGPKTNIAKHSSRPPASTQWVRCDPLFICLRFRDVLFSAESVVSSQG